MRLLETIKEHARKQAKRIVLPEGTEERTIRAGMMSFPVTFSGRGGRLALVE